MFIGINKILRDRLPIHQKEESDGKITGFEFKWNPKANASIPANFVKAYDATVEVVSKENFREFVGL